MTERVTGEAVSLDVRPASVLLRGAGAIIDAITYFTALLLTVLAVVWLAGDAIDPALGRALSVVGMVVFLLIAPMVVETASHGRSLGKLAIGARIVRDDGGAIQLRHAFIRALLGLVEIYLTFGGIAALVGLLNEKSKRLGDLMAGTYAQHERVPRFQPRSFEVPPMLAQWALTADVARMPEPLTRRIAQFLVQAERMMPGSRQRLAEALVSEVSAYVAPLPPVPPEALLFAVAAIRRQREQTGLELERQRLDALRPVLSGNPHGFPDR